MLKLIRISNITHFNENELQLCALSTNTDQKFIRGIDIATLHPDRRWRSRLSHSLPEFRIANDQNHLDMSSDTPLRITGFLLLGFLGFSLHAGIEALLLSFELSARESVSIVEAGESVEQAAEEAHDHSDHGDHGHYHDHGEGSGDDMEAMKWFIGIFVTLSALPIVLALSVKGIAGWAVTAILNVLLTGVHALHYVGEMGGGLNGVGLMSILVHVLPSAWACVLMFKWIGHLKQS